MEFVYMFMQAEAFKIKSGVIGFSASRKLLFPKRTNWFFTDNETTLTD